MGGNKLAEMTVVERWRRAELLCMRGKGRADGFAVEKSKWRVRRSGRDPLPRRQMGPRAARHPKLRLTSSVSKREAEKE